MATTGKTFGRVRKGWEAARTAAQTTTTAPAPVAAPVAPVTVIEQDSPATRTAKPSRAKVVHVSLPAVRAPGNLIAWVVLAFALGLWYVSCLATHSFLRQLTGNDALGFGWSIGAQLGFSAVERYLFAGVRNWVTIGILLFDGLINARGLFLDLLPSFFGTDVWAMLRDGLAPFVAVSTPQGAALIWTALIVGMVLAAANDGLFKLATSGRA